MNESHDSLSDALPAEGADTTEGATSLTPEPWPEEDPAHASARNERIFELRRQYPDQYAAVRDEWDGTKLVEPFVLVVSADYGAVHRAVEALSPEQAKRVMIEFLRRPGVGMMTPVWVLYDEKGNVSPVRRANDPDGIHAQPPC